MQFFRSKDGIFGFLCWVAEVEGRDTLICSAIDVEGFAPAKIYFNEEPREETGWRGGCLAGNPICDRVFQPMPGQDDRPPAFLLFIGEGCASFPHMHIFYRARRGHELAEGEELVTELPEELLRNYTLAMVATTAALLAAGAGVEEPETPDPFGDMITEVSEAEVEELGEVVAKQQGGRGTVLVVKMPAPVGTQYDEETASYTYMGHPAVDGRLDELDELLVALHTGSPVTWALTVYLKAPYEGAQAAWMPSIGGAPRLLLAPRAGDETSFFVLLRSRPLEGMDMMKVWYTVTDMTVTH